MQNIEEIQMSEREIRKIDFSLSVFKTQIVRIAIIAIGVVSLFLFIPASILKLFVRKRVQGDFAGNLYSFLGIENTIYFILIPLILLFSLIYITRTQKIRNDLKQKIKKIGFVEVKEIVPLDNQTKKDLMYSADYLIKYEKNSFHLDEEFISSTKNPELLDLKGCKVEMSKFSGFEFSRERIF